MHTFLYIFLSTYIQIMFVLMMLQRARSSYYDWSCSDDTRVHLVSPAAIILFICTTSRPVFT